MAADARDAVVSTGAPAPTLETSTGVSVGGAPAAPRRRAGRSEFLYFALRNWKFVAGAGLVLAFLALAIVGPRLTDHTPLEFTGPTDQPPSSEYWFGTTSFGQDVYAQFV
jgi:peptide/nickel transport system permease protein